MATLTEQLAANPVLYGGVSNDPYNDAAIDETWKYVLGARIGLRGLGLLNEFGPYLKDIWQGRNLLFHTPFDEMTPEDIRAYRKLGNIFYKNNLNGQTVENNLLHTDGPVSFPNGRASESDYQYMEQYPLLRKNIKEAKENTFLPPHIKYDENGNSYFRTDANGFNNLKVKWKNKLYDYQIKENSNGSGNDFYNIKPYEFLYD